MITVIIQVKVKSNQVQAFKALTLPNIQERINSAGNLRFEVYQQEDDPSRFVMVEVFRSQAEIDAYYATESYRKWHQATADMVIELTGNDYVQL
ncbi:MAG: putative quinol monooxygenase [Leptolyngbyaceae cyanobacterium]